MARSGNKKRQHKKDIRLCLSDLPDEILIHILSFLPTKSVVATSVLSRRWQFLWTSTPNLQLHESKFKRRRVFMNFAERALVLHAGSSLVSFSLSCRLKNDESRINTWITLAIQYNVEQLSLKIKDYKSSICLPSCIFGCQSLVKLDLQISSIRVPSMICLPCLKHLTLKGVEFVDNESAEKLLSHPSLEELILYECTWYNITTVNVNSPSLQSLSIDNEDEDEEVWPQERQVCFFGDNLKLFHYKGFFPPTQYCICGSTMQLREAVILVVLHGHEVQYMDGPSNRYCKLLNSLSGVQNLTLSDETLQSLNRLSQCSWLQTTLPVFDRVTQLNIKGFFETDAISIDSVFLKMLYKRCPHLEHLNFMTEIRLNEPVLSPMPLSFHTHLKKVTLVIYKAESDEESDEESVHQNLKLSHCQNALNLLFNSAPVLEEVVIHLERDDYISDQVSKVDEMERELNARPKISKDCRVSIVLANAWTLSLWD